MKLKHLQKDRALLLTSILLVLMLGAGLFSGIIGFTLGHAALKGVTQPDIRPSNKSINQQNLKTRGLEVLGEAKLIASARDLMGLPKQEDDNQPQFSTDDKPTLVFPIEGKDQGIVLVVKAAKPEGNNIRIDVALSNQGSQPAKFEPGVLTLQSEQGQAIKANVTGLPDNLAANGKATNLKVLMAKGELGDSKTVALKLTDVDRKLQLDIADIPIASAPTPPKPNPSKSAKPKLKINIPDGEVQDAPAETSSPSPSPKATQTPKASPSKRP